MLAVVSKKCIQYDLALCSRCAANHGIQREKESFRLPCGKPAPSCCFCVVVVVVVVVTLLLCARNSLHTLTQTHTPTHGSGLGEMHTSLCCWLVLTQIYNTHAPNTQTHTRENENARALFLSVSVSRGVFKLATRGVSRVVRLGVVSVKDCTTASPTSDRRGVFVAARVCWWSVGFFGPAWWWWWWRHEHEAYVYCTVGNARRDRELRSCVCRERARRSRSCTMNRLVVSSRSRASRLASGVHMLVSSSSSAAAASSWRAFQLTGVFRVRFARVQVRATRCSSACICECECRRA